MTEDDLLANVTGLCAQLGLLVFHSGDSRRDTGRGFPDLVIAGRKILYRELKADGGRLRPDQVRWKYRLLAAGCDYAVWFPIDWVIGQINDELTHATIEHALREQGWA